MQGNAPVIRRAWWWLVVWAGLVAVWAIGLIDKRGRYPGEGGEL